MKSKNKKTSFEHIADLWDIKTGDTLPSKPPSNKSGSMKVTIDEVVKMIGSLKGKRLYEMACGNGHLSRYFIERGARQVFASDVSQKLVTLAKTKYSPKGISYSVRAATDFKGIPKSYFDSVIIHQGIFYIDDLNALTKGVHRVLKKGGVFIFTLIHPLYYVAQADIGELSHLKEVLWKYQPYLKDRLFKVEKEWDVNDTQEKISYWQYRRPLSSYINMCGKNNLLVSEISEPATRVRKDDKTLKSGIPSSMIIKVVK